MPASPSAHVIFVHGLDGEPYGTWLSGSSAKDFWPEWIEQDILNVVVWSLGYEATSTWWKKGAALALPDRATSILPRLANEPGLRTGDIYFVVHSLGGLVVKQVLRFAEAQAPHSADVAQFLRRVRKIAFIGTPHGGSDQASFVNRLGLLLLPRATTAGLSRNDPHLRDLNVWFRSFAARNSIDVLVMHETQRVSFAGIPGLGGIVVKADSADPGLSPATNVIPIVADHFSIVAPRNREADVYQNLLAFLAKPSTGKHADTLIADVGEIVERRTDELSSQIDASRIHILAAIEGAQRPRSAGENAVVTAELERRLSTLRKSRYVVGYDAPGEARRLAKQLASGGDLETASGASKRVAYAWCGRILAAVDLDVAEQCLDGAQAQGAGEENVIAGAFIAAFRSQNASAGLAMLAGITTQQVNTARFLIAANKKEPAEAIKWLQEAGLSAADLDSDGRFGVIQRRISVRTAILTASAFAPYRVGFFEEPLPYENAKAMIDLKRQMPVPLATGEHFSNRWEFRELVEGGGVDFLQPDICHGGGITELKRIAAFADMHFMQMAPHNSGGPISTLATMHLLAAIPNAYILEQMEDERELRNSISTVPVQFENGHFVLPTGPGLGTDLDLDAIRDREFRKHPTRHNTVSHWY